MKIDWLAYYQEFVAIHGGSPILIGSKPNYPRSGYMLFPDGWRYSRNHVSGPEYPPRNPEEQKELIQLYWKTRKETVQFEYAKLAAEIRDLIKVQQTRSAPLPLPTPIVEEDDNGKRVRRVTIESVNFDELLNKLRGLKAEIKHCQEMLTSIALPTSTSIEFSPASIVAELEEIESAGS